MYSDGYCDQFGGCGWEGPQFDCPELSYDCGDCNDDFSNILLQQVLQRSGRVVVGEEDLVDSRRVGSQYHALLGNRLCSTVLSMSIPSRLFSTAAFGTQACRRGGGLGPGPGPCPGPGSWQAQMRLMGCRGWNK